MFLKPLDSQSRGKTLEMIIEKRMQNMVHYENKNIIFVDRIHFEKSQKKLRIVKTGGSENNEFLTHSISLFYPILALYSNFL